MEVRERIEKAIADGRVRCFRCRQRLAAGDNWHRTCSLCEVVIICDACMTPHDQEVMDEYVWYECHEPFEGNFFMLDPHVCWELKMGEMESN
jgi:hypothetical protein